MLGGARLDGRRQAGERLHVLGERADVGFRQLDRRDAGLLGAGDDLVVDVGEVAHEGDVVAEEAQVAEHDVEGHQRARVADVRAVVDRHAADVHADFAGKQRDEFFEAAGQCVVEFQGHMVGG